MELNQRKYWKSSIVLFVVLIIFSFYDLSLGSYSVALSDILKSIFNYAPTNQDEFVVHVFRLPRVLIAIYAGAALAVSGLLMQTLFQNPLAAPYVLGINSGASLLVAIATMSSFYIFNSEMGIVTAAMLGAFFAGILILMSSIYVKNKVSLLLIGIMFGSFAGAVVNVIESYANPNSLKSFMLWSFGSLQSVEVGQLGGISILIFLGIALSFLLVKPLNLLTLGDKSASLLGVNIKLIRILIIIATAVLTGIITAFCGPIAFVGLVVPNLIKLIYKTANHFYLMLGCIFGGALLVLFCDIVMQWISPFANLPLNALTALIGAPVVVWIIIRKF